MFIIVIFALYYKILYLCDTLLATRKAQGEPLLNSGAAGFVLSRGSLSLLREAWSQNGVAAEDGSLEFSPERSNEGDRKGSSAGGVHHSRAWAGGGAGKIGLPREIIAAARSECVAKSKFERGNPGMVLRVWHTVVA